jgi:phosphohistidine phosphatase
MESQPVPATDGAAPESDAVIAEASPPTPEPRARVRRVGRSLSYALELLIVRHGPAGDRDEWAKTGKDDDERPLTPRGTREMRRAARGLRQLVGSVDAIGTSPLVRARETAEILGRAFAIEPDEARAIGDGDRRGMLRWVRSTAAAVAKKRRGERLTIAIVGHEPDLSAAICWLLTGRPIEEPVEPWTELKKGGACLLSFAGHLKPRRATLRWLLTRSQLERIAR